MSDKEGVEPQEEKEVLSSEVVTSDQKESELPKAAELSEIEQEAVAAGWTPKEQWSGDPNSWRPAKEYLSVGPLYKEISRSHKQLKQMEERLAKQEEYAAKREKAAYEQAKTDLYSQLAAAAEEGDSTKVLNVNKQIVQMERASGSPEASPQLDLNQDQLVREFAERNKVWYNKNTAANKDLVDYAQTREIEIREGNPNMPLKDVLQQVEEDVRYKQGKSSPVQQSAPVSAVDVPSEVGQVKRSVGRYSLNDLTPEQKEMALFYKDNGVMEIDAYIKGLVEVGELK